MFESLDDSSSVSSLELFCEVENATEGSGGGIEPYRYEPYVASEMTDDSGSENGGVRLDEEAGGAEAEETGERRQGNIDW